MAAGWLVLMLQVNVLLKANVGLRGVQPYCYHQLLMVAFVLMLQVNVRWRKREPTKCAFF